MAATYVVQASLTINDDGTLTQNVALAQADTPLDVLFLLHTILTRFLDRKNIMAALGEMAAEQARAQAGLVLPTGPAPTSLRSRGR